MDNNQTSGTETITAKPQAEPVHHLLGPKEAAAYLGATEKALENWRGTGAGPAFIRLSPRCVRYALEDLDTHIAASRKRSTAEA
ncbi:helix-turn-helix transcriptional regulator [Acidocella sp.]|jgi:hypothetical protein|uniref:helix-turn-helix transcriptional regulator n=1 Tax=Acidocella sp. TaxID=50710 RepID=UPI002F3E67EC